MLARASLSLKRTAAAAAAAAAPMQQQRHAALRLSTAVTPQAVKELRERSGAPMMDCKKALADPSVAGDFEKAMNWLRMKGIAKAAQAERVSQEGLIAFLHTPKVCTLLEINSETDFVGKNEKFHAFVSMVAQVCNTSLPGGPVDVEKLLGQTDATTQKTVKDALGDIVNQIRENIVVRRGLNIETGGALVAGYVHGKVGADTLPAHVAMGKSAGVVVLKLAAAGPPSDVVQDAARKLAMHVVAAAPLYLDASSVPAAFVEAETALFREQSEETNAKEAKPKPKDILEKIIAGKVNKRLSEICLLSQPHVAEEGSPAIAKYLQGLGTKAGGAVTINAFERWTLGQK
jgi:elongation factor Ts